MEHTSTSTLLLLPLPIIPNLHACRYPRVGFQQTGYRWQTFCQDLLMKQIPGLTCPGLSTLSVLLEADSEWGRKEMKESWPPGRKSKLSMPVSGLTTGASSKDAGGGHGSPSRHLAGVLEWPFDG